MQGMVVIGQNSGLLPTIINFDNLEIVVANLEVSVLTEDVSCKGRGISIVRFSGYYGIILNSVRRHNMTVGETERSYDGHLAWTLY